MTQEEIEEIRKALTGEPIVWQPTATATGDMHEIVRDICPGGCGWDFAEFPEMRHTEEECGGPDCSCYEIIGGHQMGCAFYGVNQ